jgi:hypothetical protein
LKVSDALFGECILKMCIDSTVGNGLGLELDVVDKALVGEASVVAMIMLDGNAMRLRKSFESSLGGESFFPCTVPLKVYIGQSTVMVNKDGSDPEATSSEPT